MTFKDLTGNSSGSSTKSSKTRKAAPTPRQTPKTRPVIPALSAKSLAIANQIKVAT
jgi:hypothetical protein